MSGTNGSLVLQQRSVIDGYLLLDLQPTITQTVVFTQRVKSISVVQNGGTKLQIDYTSPALGNKTLFVLEVGATDLGIAEDVTSIDITNIGSITTDVAVNAATIGI